MSYEARSKMTGLLFYFRVTTISIRVYYHSMKTQRIIQMYVHDKQSLNTIAKALGMASKTVRKVLLENGHEIRSKNAIREVNISEEVLRDMYLKRKMSCADIAEHLDVAHGTVHNYLKKYSLNNRSAIESKSSDSYTIWDTERLEKCRQLLLEHRSYQAVAELLDCTSNAVENKNRDNWQISMSIWTEREDEIKSYLKNTRNYADTSYKFGISEVALQCKNNRSWHIDLSMNSTMFGIPTKYHGVQYRSKKEAIIAQYFTERDVKFEYEKSVVEGHNWTCDFYLLDCDMWIEYDGLEIGRESTKSIPYNRDNPKICHYRENGYRHMILGKRTWQKQLDDFLARNSVLFH